MKSPFPVSLLLALCAAALPGLRAQTTVFHDTFGDGSTVNSSPTSPAQPSVDQTAYQQLAAKPFNPNPPTIGAAGLRFGSNATSSGFSCIEALFTRYPVTLANVDDYIEMTVVFTNDGGLMNAPAATLFFGLHDAGQVQPIPGGMAGTIGTATAGYAQNWQGYVSRILYAGGTHAIATRGAQSATAVSNQDVLYNYNTVGTFGATATPSVPAFTTGWQYTEVLRITKTGDSALTVVSSLHQGADTTGPQIFTQTATSTSILTSTFDGLAVGFRPVGGVVTIMNVNSLKIVTNAATTIVPVFTTQPSPLSQTLTVGTPASYTVAANGGGATALSYQWQKSIDDGVTYTDLPDQTGATLSIAATALGHSGKYRVLATNVAGQTASTAVTLNVTTGTFAPAITADPSPASATVTTGAGVSFTAQVSGSPQPSVQWQKSTDGGLTYTDVGAAGTDSPSTFTIAAAQLSDTALYRVVATNTQGTAISEPASLTVQKGVAITAQPAGAVIAPEAAHALSVTVNADATPAPTYLWEKTIDGLAFTTVQDGPQAALDLTGSTDSSGFYRVTVSNAVNSVTSELVYAGVASATLGAPAFGPSNNAVNVNRDTPLVLTFSTLPIVGNSGAVRVHDAADDSLVATIDLARMRTSGLTASSSTYGVYHFAPHSIRGEPYYTTPIITLGTQPAIQSRGPRAPPAVHPHTAMIFLPSSTTLAYGKTYYVKIDAGVFVDASGATFPGIADTTTWRFTTKSAGPADDAASITVANDGAPSDFSTLQGASDFIPTNNTIPRTINLRDGVYYEQVSLKSPNVALRGQSRHGTIVAWLSNGIVNNIPGSPVTSQNSRAVFRVATNDVSLRDLTVYNLTPQGGSQAEAANLIGQRILVENVSLFSYQDTYLGSGSELFHNCYIEGDVDFLWGGGATFFKNCTLHMARQSGGYYAQIRSTTNHGFVFLDCTFTAVAGANNTHYLNRIDPNFYPNSEMVLIDCTIGNDILNTTVAAVGNDYNVGWWKLNGSNASTPVPSARFWDHDTRDQNGAPLDFGPRASFTRRLTSPADAADIANYSDPAWVLNGWSPTLAPADPLADFVAGFGLDPATIGAPAADPDSDGIANLLEFFLGGDPTEADAEILPAVAYQAPANGGPAIVFDFYRNTAAAGAAYVVEYSTDLNGTWTTAIHGTNGISIVTVPVDGNFDHITVTIPSAGPRLFARLRL